MALFKINKGQKINLPTTYNAGYCYLTTDDGKFYIDTSNTAAGRIVLNAGVADALTVSAGNANSLIYFENGIPVVSTQTVGNSHTPIYLNQGSFVECSDLLINGLTYINDTEPTEEEYTLWVDTNEEEEGLTGLIQVSSDIPTLNYYNLWINPEADSPAAMRADAIKYKAFSITTGSWSGSGPYTYTMTATGITANSAILNLTLDAASQTYQKAQLDWETGANTIILSTATKPTGTLTGYLIATDVTVI